MKKLIVAIAVFGASFGVMSFVTAAPTTSNSSDTSSVCPEGSYEVEGKNPKEPLCRLYPTGCPYGDSIPLGPECDKHADEWTQATIQNTPTDPAVVENKTNPSSCGK